MKQSYSFIILRKGSKIIYKGSENDINIENYLPDFGEFDTNIEGGFYIDTNKPFLLKQQDFHFVDGSEGSIFIITDVRNWIPQIRNSAQQLVLVFIIVTLLTALISVYWIYFSIIKPFNTLRIATSEITKVILIIPLKGILVMKLGNFVLILEEMRIRIKELLEGQLESEKEY